MEVDAPGVEVDVLEEDGEGEMYCAVKIPPARTGMDQERSESSEIQARRKCLLTRALMETKSGSEDG